MQHFNLAPSSNEESQILQYLPCKVKIKITIYYSLSLLIQLSKFVYDVLSRWNK